MANSGYKNWLTLRKYINGVATDETKTNDAADADYIAPVIDLSACGTVPNTCPQLTSPIADKTATVGDANISIDLSAVFTGGDADPLTYTAVSSNNVAVSTEIQGSTLILSVVGGSAATSTISVTCSDGTCAATDSFVFTLNAAATTAPPTTTTTTTTQAPTCPALVTIADTAFTTVTSSQTYTSLGGYCIQDGYSTEYGKWYIDTSGSTLGVYVWEASGGSNTSCPSGTTTPLGTVVTQWVYGEDDIITSTNTLYNTGITWVNGATTYDIIAEWAGGGRVLDNIYAAPRCGTPQTTTTTTLAKPSGDTYGSHSALESSTNTFRAVWTGSYNGYQAFALAKFLTGQGTVASNTEYSLNKQLVTLYYNSSPYASAGTITRGVLSKVKWYTTSTDAILEITNVTVGGPAGANTVNGTFIYNG